MEALAVRSRLRSEPDSQDIPDTAQSESSVSAPSRLRVSLIIRTDEAKAELKPGKDASDVEEN